MSKIEVDTVAPQSGTTLVVGETGDTVNLSNATVTLPSSTVSVTQLSATGTKDSTTFLRGDNTFQVVTTDLVNDTTPQLGGALDINSQEITGSLIPSTTDTYDLGS